MNSLPISKAYQYCPLCKNSLVPALHSLRCEGCGHTMYFTPVAAVGGLVVNQADQLLFVKRARDPGKGKWGLPGGFVDPGENAEQATIREVEEETQLKVIETEYLCSHPNEYDYRGVISSVIDIFYLCKVHTVENVVVDQQELADYTWAVPDQEHLDNMAFLSNRRAIEHWVQQS